MENQPEAGALPTLPPQRKAPGRPRMDGSPAQWRTPPPPPSLEPLPPVGTVREDGKTLGRDGVWRQTFAKSERRTAAEVDAIRDEIARKMAGGLWTPGKSDREMAEKHGCSESWIHQLVMRASERVHGAGDQELAALKAAYMGKLHGVMADHIAITNLVKKHLADPEPCKTCGRGRADSRLIDSYNNSAKGLVAAINEASKLSGMNRSDSPVAHNVNVFLDRKGQLNADVEKLFAIVQESVTPEQMDTIRGKLTELVGKPLTKALPAPIQDAEFEPIDPDSSD